MEVAIDAGSHSACLGQYAHAPILHVKESIVCGFPIAYITATAMKAHLALVTVSANDCAIRCCYRVLTSFSELPFFEATIFPMQR